MRKQWKRAEGRRDRVKSLRAHARNTDSGVEAKGTRFVFKGRRRQSFDARPLAPIGHRKLINSLKGRLARTSWDDLKCIEEILNAYDGGAFDDLMTIAQDHADGLYNDDVTADDVRTTGAAD
jgi:hypothetical protein